MANQLVASGYNVTLPAWYIPLSSLFTWTDFNPGATVVAFSVDDYTIGAGQLYYSPIGGYLTAQLENQSLGPFPISQLSSWFFHPDASGSVDQIAFNVIDSLGNSASAVTTVTGSATSLPDLNLSVPSVSVNSTSIQFNFEWAFSDVPSGAPFQTWVDGIYLSRDPVIDSADTLLWTTTSSAPPGGSGGIGGGLSLPSNLPYGTYYIGVIADIFNQVAEANENNNASVGIPITIGDRPPVALPDFAVASRGTKITADATHGVLANDDDPDGDALTVTDVNGVALNVGRPVTGLYGTLTLNADGSYTYAAKQNAPSASHDQFTYTVSDGHGGTADSFLNIAVTNKISEPYSLYSPVVAITVFFSDGSYQNGSGVLISPNEILTAAHLFEQRDNSIKVTGVRVQTALEASTGGTRSEFETQNVSTIFGNHSSNNAGGPSGTAALVQGYYDPILPNGLSSDPSHDIAVLGISKNIGNTLGWLPIQPNAPVGSYTLVGFSGGTALTVDTANADISSKNPGEWHALFNASGGMSGGPLLAADHRVVGILSEGSELLGRFIPDVAVRIDAKEKHQIRDWMQADQFLATNPAQLVQFMAAFGADQNGLPSSSAIQPNLLDSHYLIAANATNHG